MQFRKRWVISYWLSLKYLWRHLYSSLRVGTTFRRQKQMRSIPFRHNVSIADRCRDVIKATNSKVSAGIRWHSQRFLSPRRSATLDGSLQVHIPSWEVTNTSSIICTDSQYGCATVELFTSTATDIHNCRVNNNDPINATFPDASTVQRNHKPVRVRAGPVFFLLRSASGVLTRRY